MCGDGSVPQALYLPNLPHSKSHESNQYQSPAPQSAASRGTPPRRPACAGLLADLCVMSRVVLVEFTKSVDRALSCLLADLGPPASLSTSSPTLLCLGTLNRRAHLLAGGEDPDRALSYLLTDPPPRQDRTSSPTLTTARRCSDSRQRSRYACSKQRRSKRLNDQTIKTTLTAALWARPDIENDFFFKDYI